MSNVKGAVLDAIMDAVTATDLASVVAIGAVSAPTVRLARRSPLTLLGEL
jgi:hypothetical protein